MKPILTKRSVNPVLTDNGGLRQANLFKPNSNDHCHNLINDEFSGSINLNSVSNPFFTNLYTVLRNNYWMPIFSQKEERRCYEHHLTPSQRFQFKLLTAYLTRLDSAQVRNIFNLGRFICPPEVVICTGEQLSQESMHVKSYQYIGDAILPRSEVDDIFTWVERGGRVIATDEFLPEDKFAPLSSKREAEIEHQLSSLVEQGETSSNESLRLLFNHFSHIAQKYQALVDNPTILSFGENLVHDLILEHLYFNSGFLFFYALGEKQLMSGTKGVIRLIDRDERTHTKMYGEIIKWFTSQNKCLSQDHIHNIFGGAYEEELNWLNHLGEMDDAWVFQDKDLNKQYVQQRVNLMCKLCGVPTLWDGNAQDPYINLSKQSDADGALYVNFFEENPTSYKSANHLLDFHLI